MRNLFLFIKRFYPFFLFLLLEVLAVILITRNNSFQRATFINSANEVTGLMYDSRHGMQRYFKLKQNNDLLQEENAQLRRQLANMRERADSGYVDTVGEELYAFVPARVIHHSSRRRMNYFTLNQGGRDGIEPGMGVVDSRGLVGMITNVSTNYAVGLSMLNTKTRVSVKHARSGAIGIMRWQGLDPLDHIVEDMTKTAGVRVGDTIVTSGYSTYFPPDLPVGIVTSAELLEGSNFYDISIRLTNEIMSLEKAYVVKHFFKPELDSLEQAAR